MRLARNRAGQQGLAGARRADEQRALRQLGAYFGVLARVVQEVDNFLKRILGLVLSGHVREGDARLRFGVQLGSALAEAHGGHVAHASAHFLYHPAVQQNAAAVNDNERQYPRQEEAKQRRILGGYLVRVCYLVRGGFDTVLQVEVRENACFVNLLRAVFIGRNENYLRLRFLIGDFLHAAVVNHFKENVVSDFCHLPLEHRREQQRVQQYEYKKRYNIVINNISSGFLLIVVRLCNHIITFPF